MAKKKAVRKSPAKPKKKPAKKSAKDSYSRNYQARLMREKRALERSIQIPEVVDAKRKAKCRTNPFLFLQTYFAEKFYNPFTDNQTEIIKSIQRIDQFGGDQAIAAPRGDGKTSIVEGVAMWAICYGHITFMVIIAANGEFAGRILKNIKAEFAHNEVLLADFPEICAPIKALEGMNNRAGGQMYKGAPTNIQWAGDNIILPTIPRSKASGSILYARGIDGAIRGIKFGARRPDFVLIDDPETPESARSDSQIRNRRDAIDRDVAGLGGPDKTIARVVLTTIMNRTSLSFELTDPVVSQNWSPKRMKLMVEEPTRIVCSAAQESCHMDGCEWVCCWCGGGCWCDVDRCLTTSCHTKVADVTSGLRPN